MFHSMNYIKINKTNSMAHDHNVSAKTGLCQACIVTERQRYSSNDLSQRGFEVPCILAFESPPKP